MITKRGVVVGSGASIRQGKWDIPIHSLPVWSAIQNELSIGINWCYKYFNPTVTLFGDFEFYRAEFENLRKLPLAFGMQDAYWGKTLKVRWPELYHLEDNIYLLPNRLDGKYWGTDAWKYGFYDRWLSGILGINLAVALGCTEIYLLGFDCCSTEGRTHFYQDEFKAVHRSQNDKDVSGVGFSRSGNYKTNLYNQDFDEKFFPFKKELERIEILNVSKNSGITVFPKIGYSEFYDRLLKGEVQEKPQDKLRDEILNIYKESYYA